MENLHDKVLGVEDSEALRLLTLRDIYYMCLVQKILLKLLQLLFSCHDSIT